METTYIFSGWVKVPVRFAVRSGSEHDAIRRAQLGDYDTYDLESGTSVIDFSINPTRCDSE